jgi:hypothetical protein
MRRVRQQRDGRGGEQRAGAGERAVRSGTAGGGRWRVHGGGFSRQTP